MILIRNKNTFNPTETEKLFVKVNKSINPRVDNDYAKIYIGRGSIFGNPFEMKNQSQKERERVIRKFEKLFYSLDGIQMRAEAQKLVEKHRNIVLLCYCYPKLCHGDVIRDYMVDVLQADKLLS